MSNRRKQSRSNQPDRHAERVKAYAELVRALTALIPVLVAAVLTLYHLV